MDAAVASGLAVGTAALDAEALGVLKFLIMLVRDATWVDGDVTSFISCIPATLF